MDPELSESVVFSQDAWRAMSRIHAAHTASWVADEGLALVSGAGDSAGLVEAIDFKTVAAASKGVIADMDLVGANLVATFKEDAVPA